MVDRSSAARPAHHLLRRKPISYRRIGTRGRVVMLVDNSVAGDSRVQKQARSAADRGWDVILLGCRRRSAQLDHLPSRWRIGRARVRLLRLDEDMKRRRHELRRGWIRSPLAYPGVEFARHRQAEVVAGISDLRFRVAATRRWSRPTAALARQWHRLRLHVLLRLLLPWVDRRVASTVALDQRRRRMTGLLDRFTTWWWTRTRGRTAWRRLDPHLLEYEAVYGPVVDELEPDIIHANDYRMLGVGARAATRAAARGRQVKLVWDAHEFLPGLAGTRNHPRWHHAQVLHERQFAPYADAVVTVTEGLADALQHTHSLPQRPTVVLNAPVATASGERSRVDIRTRCHLSEDSPLLVYSGVALVRRGLGTMVEALPQLPGVHVALVVPHPVNAYVEQLQRRANALGVADRLHVLPYVPVEEIVPFLRTATIGVFPVHRNPNHDLSLPTKLFEYAQAGLPVLVSDVRDTAAAVTRYQVGEVFSADDTEDFVRAARMLLADPDRYRAAYDRMDVLEEWTWEHQAEILDEVYERVLRASAKNQPGARRA